MLSPQSPPQEKHFGAVFVLLAVATLLRFYKLDAPNVWMDEFLSIHYAALPFQALISLVQQHTELPLFSLIIKAIGLIQNSDWSFRAVSALAGVLTVGLFYTFCKNIFGWETAFTAASLLAVNSFHVFISRQIRVYSLFNLFVLMVFFFLFTFIKAPTRRNLLRLILVNGPIILLHRFAAYLVFAEVVIVLFFALRGRIAFGKVLTLFGGTGLFFLPVVYLSLGNPLLGTMNTQIGIPNNIGGLADISFTVGMMGNRDLLFLFCAVFILAWMRMRRIDSDFAWTALLFIFVPLALLIPTFKAMYSPHTFFYMLFPSYVLIASAAVSLLRSPVLANALGLSVCVVGSGLVVIFNYATLFADNAQPSYGWHTENYRNVASALQSQYSGHDNFFTFSNTSFEYNVDWYLRTKHNSSLLAQPSLKHPDMPVSYHFVASYNYFGHWAHTKQELFEKLTPSQTEKVFGESTIYSWSLVPDRLRIMSGPVYTYRFEAMPRPLYAESADFAGVMLLPNWGSSVIASDNDRAGFMEYCFSPADNSSFTNFNVNVFYENTGEGNLFSLKYKFDDEPFQTALISRGPDSSDRMQANFNRQSPYSKLTLRFELLCTLLAPDLIGRNLVSLKLEKFNVFAGPENKPDSAFLAFVDLAPTGFSTKSSLKPDTVTIENLDIIEKETTPGWSCYTPKDKALPGVVILHFRKERSSVVFYPRVNSGMVRVVEDIGGIPHEHFRLHGPGTQWSPLASLASVPLPHKRNGEDVTLRFELSGDAQLWISGQAVF